MSMGEGIYSCPCRRYQSYDERPDRRRFVLTGCSRETVRPFKSVRSLNMHVPALSRTRSGDRNTPVALSITECVLNVRGDLSTQLGITEILQLNRDSHHVTILSKTHCPSAVQTGQGRAGLMFRRIVNSLIHKSC
jgi:hypothetical protein